MRVFQYRFCTACNVGGNFLGPVADALTSIHFAFKLGALGRILNDFPLRFSGDLAENRVNIVYGPPRYGRVVQCDRWRQYRRVKRDTELKY